jgi:UDP-N-acetylglucosamine--N-acetylmuramyl-(pentapeptide) pyrophosphoryl-undecaprenol N-acetylglucosamine transferase
MAGGTGGHIFPALAVAEILRAEACELLWLGTRAGMESRIIPEAGIAIEWLSVAGFRGKGWAGKLTAPFKLLLACWQAVVILRRFKPDVVLGMGGFVAGPGGLMARLLGIPLVIHEQNRIPGTTNRLLVNYADKILEAFPGSFAPKVGAVCVGNPLRKSIMATMASQMQRQANDKIHVLVFGGSLGAAALNDNVPEAIALTGANFSIRHQTGEAQCAQTQAHYQRLGLQADVTPFIQNMAAAYQWADVAICRAGAMTLSELSAAGLPAILVPYPFAIDDHQTANARYLSEAGAALLLPQNELTPQRLAEHLHALIQSPSRLQTMSAQAKSLAKPEAAKQVADICLSEVQP